jgi:hypothetical protein
MSRCLTADQDDLRNQGHVQPQRPDQGAGLSAFVGPQG